MTTFETIFDAATGRPPYPFQRRFAKSPDLYSLASIPTGLGKTGMAVFGWLWRRRFADASVRTATPRRLVYCLPMRVLVEQTRDIVHQWLRKLNLAEDVRVAILMGGEEPDDWDLHPECDVILIGTQDMLLSRALNRGYGMSRARWPVAFGLLNTDCLWVFDEIQLMGAGLATSAQLEAFRRILPSSDGLHSKNGHGCRSLWMSATMQRDWLKTVDFDPAALGILQLEADDLSNKEISQRHEAKKPLRRAGAAMGEFDKLAPQVVEEHSKFKGRTLVVINTVKRARDLFDAILKHVQRGAGKGTNKRPIEICERPKLVLLHSRFRPEDRATKVKEFLAEPGPSGMICVSTQVVEAGVDVSATTLFTELAPWASLVQRFGRCNRRGDDNASARVFWIDVELPKDEKKAKDAARPYEPNALREARGYLEKCPDVGSSRLPSVPLCFEHTHFIRRKDLIDLFDTTPDLAGNDIDIDRYVREIEETDVRVFWREWDGAGPLIDKEWRRIAREELCPAPIGEFREFVNANRGQIWRWDFLDGNWVRVDANSVYPGQTYLAHVEAGGYQSDRGWNQKIAQKVTPVSVEGSAMADLPPEQSTDDEPLSEIGRWQTIAEHTDQVCTEIDAIIATLPLAENERSALEQAGRWHDWGKAHEVFRSALPEGAPEKDAFWAKAAGRWKKYPRPHFRHELASTFGVLGLPNNYAPTDLRDLVAYLIAAHHGKVRLSIRSLPGEKRPGNGLRFARGVWEGDALPSANLGGGTTAPATVLSLERMELGYSCDGQPSWTERALRLRSKFGPFRLAYLEALLRAADMRASANAVRERANYD